MATTSTIIEISQPPFNRQIYNPQLGYMDLAWQDWFQRVYKRIGGSKASSNSTLESNSTENSTDISALKVNIQTNIDNIEKLDTRLTTAEDTLKNTVSQQDIDHESIVTAGQLINSLQTSVQTNTQNITTLTTNYNNLATRVDDLEDKKSAFTQVSALPSSSEYANSFVFYSGNICYSTDGVNWKKVSDNSVVT